MTILFAQATIEHLPIADESIDLIFTDPPYPREYLPCYGWLAREAMRVLKPGGFLITMAGGMFLNQIYRMLDDSGMMYFYEMTHLGTGDAPCIWPRSVIARTKPIIIYSKGAALPRLRNVLNLYESNGKMKQYHHWGQNVGAARYYIDCFSRPGDLILDPFIGGGTTAVACALINRRCIAFDLEADAVKISSDRLRCAEPLTNGRMF